MREIIMITLAITLCMVSPMSENTEENFDNVIENLFSDSSECSVKALIKLLNSDVLLQKVPDIIERIDHSSSIALNVTPINKKENMPKWHSLSFPLIRTTDIERKEAILITLCTYIRLAENSQKKDEAQRTVMEYLKKDYDNNRSVFLLQLMSNLYLWGLEIIPESDCRELIQFVDSLLEKHSTKERILTEQEINALSSILFSYINTTSIENNREQLISHYENYFSPGFGKQLRKNEEYLFFHITESYYRELLKKSPEELLELIKDNCEHGFYGMSDRLIAGLLAGTCELRRKNFDLLLPCMYEASTLYGDSFLTMYCTPPAADASPEEKKQVDIVLDILEAKIRQDSGKVQVTLLERFLKDTLWSECDSELDYEYAFDRVKRIAEEEGLLPEYYRKELLEFLKHQFPGRFQEQ